MGAATHAVSPNGQSGGGQGSRVETSQPPTASKTGPPVVAKRFVLGQGARLPGGSSTFYDWRCRIPILEACGPFPPCQTRHKNHRPITPLMSSKDISYLYKPSHHQKLTPQNQPSLASIASISVWGSGRSPPGRQGCRHTECCLCTDGLSQSRSLGRRLMSRNRRLSRRFRSSHYSIHGWLVWV